MQHPMFLFGEGSAIPGLFGMLAVIGLVNFIAKKSGPTGYRWLLKLKSKI